MAGMSGKKKADGTKADGGLSAYQAAGGRVSGPGGFTSTAGMARASVGSAAGITPDRDIVWAPEDPSKPIQGEDMWQKAENKSWHISHVEASSHSRQSGKPMLIWFTDSAHSPLCRQLSSELFSKSEFEGWAKERLVRLRVDSTLPGKERNTNLGVRKKKYVDQLKRRYDVHGHPTVVVVSPRGAVIQSYRGYRKGNFDYYWGRIKQAQRIAETEYGAWREKLEQRGYRMWESRDGRKRLAKLYRYRSGKVTLIDPDGNWGTTSFRKLSDADQAWILLQKKRYEQQKSRQESSTTSR
jgi:hypothetical protein